MASKKMLIIPVFIPFSGCGHRCVFCDQTGITGTPSPPGHREVTRTISTYLKTWKGGGRREVAFYGGTFTALPASVQKGYLDCAAPFVSDGRIDGVRVSTRPDCVGDRVVEELKANNVDTVELGVQSTSDTVLRLSGRGHLHRDTVEAVGALRGRGLKVGLQFMPGLPGDTRSTILKTTRDVVSLAPDFVRVYPTVVLRGTALEGLYRSGGYAPWSLEEMVEVCGEITELMAKIPIIRMGLPHSTELAGRVVAGPYHPSFKDLVSRNLAAPTSLPSPGAKARQKTACNPVGSR